MEQQLLQYGFTFLLVAGIAWFLIRTVHQLAKNVRGESSGCHGAGCGEDDCCSSQPRQQAIPIPKQEQNEKRLDL